jgi:hypothetical protein
MDRPYRHRRSAPRRSGLTMTALALWLIVVVVGALLLALYLARRFS